MSVTLPTPSPEQPKLTRYRRFARFLKRLSRSVGRYSNRGWLYRIISITVPLAIALYLIVLGAVAFGVIEYRLDWNSIVSVFVADVPVGLVLFLILDRRESGERKLLNAVDIVKIPADFAQLIVHYSDEWEHGQPEYIHYFVVNTNTNVAYLVDERVQKLIEARMIRKFPKHRDVEELNLYFDTNGIMKSGGYPEGDDLLKTKNGKKEV